MFETNPRCEVSVLGYKEGPALNALFAGILDLVQLNSSYYIISEHGKPCLRQMKKSTSAGQDEWIVSTYAGNCKEKNKDIDGLRLDARFQTALDPKIHAKFLFFIDRILQQIKRIDMSSNYLMTVHKSDIVPRRLVLGKNINEFYVAVGYGILHIKDGEESWLAGGETAGDVIGQLNQAKFNLLIDLERLRDKTLLVAESGNGSMKVIDLEARNVYKICEGKLVGFLLLEKFIALVVIAI